MFGLGFASLEAAHPSPAGAPNVLWTEASAEMLVAAAGAWMLVALDKPTWAAVRIGRLTSPRPRGHAGE